MLRKNKPFSPLLPRVAIALAEALGEVITAISAVMGEVKKMPLKF